MNSPYLVSPPKARLAFQMANCGMGDYIHFLSALNYVRHEHPHVEGVIGAPPYIVPLIKNATKYWKNWGVRGIPMAYKDRDYPKYGFTIEQGKFNQNGIHPRDLAMLSFCNMAPCPPEYQYVVSLNFEKPKPKSIEAYGKYIVMTPVASHTNRQMRPDHYNRLVSHAMSMGYNVVHLGTTKMGDRKLLLHDGYDKTKGTWVLDQTTILEAAEIMHYAEGVVGIDNGLLHLAGMTGTPFIMFGHTITKVAHRHILRENGRTIDLTIEDALPCAGCQSRMRFMEHNFHYCPYGTDHCTSVHAQLAGEWEKILQEQLEINEKGRNQI